MVDVQERPGGADRAKSRSDPASALVRGLLGFFGAVLAFVLLPRATRFFLKRYASTLVKEVLAIVTLGYLSEALFTRAGGVKSPQGENPRDREEA